MQEQPTTPTPQAGAAAISLALDAEELRVLHDLLRSSIEETRFEAARTDTLAYRRIVQHREQVLRRIFERMRTAPGGNASTPGVH